MIRPYSNTEVGQLLREFDDYVLENKLGRPKRVTMKWDFFLGEDRYVVEISYLKCVVQKMTHDYHFADVLRERVALQIEGHKV